ncbi:MAG TPA: radical SAM protein [Polyangiales bacterium]|nr:radical SAM protein [Polyangiales bacterium]
MTAEKRVQFVVKVSKHCNLRCRYCYEFEDLGKKERMTLEQHQRLYANIAGWLAKQREPTQVEFVWHGGEPLLISPDFYWRSFDVQAAAFGANAPRVRNVVQTNLTLLDAERLRLLKDGFDGVGVSLDVFGGLRVNLAGRDSVPRVLKNIDQLRAARIDFGCITVLTRANLRSIRKIIRFFDRLKPSSLRVLPLFDGAFEGQHAGYEITREEVVSAFQAIFEELVLLESSLRVEPIHQYVNQVFHHHMPGAVPRYYDKRVWEPVYIVDLNGDLYSYAQTYDSAAAHGNLFESPLEAIVHSPAHLRVIEAAEQRLAGSCHKCRFHGSCDGSPMAEDAGRLASVERNTHECTLEHAILTYLERRLTELNALQPVSSAASLPAPHPTLRHLDQLPLQPEVRIRAPHLARTDLVERVTLNGGTELNRLPPGDGLSYLPAAIVPREDWRSLTDRDAELLLAREGAQDWRIGSDVAIVRIPDEIIAPLERIFEERGTRDSLAPEQYELHTNHPHWDAAYDRVADYLLKQYALRPHVPQVVRLATAPASMRTVTKDKVSGRTEHYYVGLHMDTWEAIPIWQRNLARNRICLNLGRDDRYLLFINLTMQKINDLLGHADLAQSNQYYGTDLGHEFMQTYPAYPVTRLRIRPREAYIAPTDNFIHDGSSAGGRHPDIALHMLGYFGIERRVASYDPVSLAIAGTP